MSRLRRSSAAGGRTKQIHLLVFEGTERVWQTLHLRGATHLVTHLELRLQRARDEAALVQRFPALRGLSCESTDVETLLAESLPELRALVVRGNVDPTWLVRLVEKRAPQLELWDVNFATEFPFAALEAARDAWCHLRYLGLPGHLVSDEARARFADDPQVVFVGHDRREVIALDFEMHGWADTAR